MSSERDELAQIVRLNLISYVSDFQAREVARSIRAAGYIKPRTVTTAEELDALPHHTMIYTADGDHAEHVYDQWFIPGVNYRYTSATIALPATVTWEPAV